MGEYGQPDQNQPSSPVDQDKRQAENDARTAREAQDERDRLAREGGYQPGGGDPREGEETEPPDEERDPEELEREKRAENPESYTGLDFSKGGVFEYRELENNKSRTLNVDGYDLEHVSTDAEGVWCYRVQD